MGMGVKEGSWNDLVPRYRISDEHSLETHPVAEDPGRLNKLNRSTDRKRQRMKRLVMICSLLFVLGFLLMKKNQAVATREMKNRGLTKYLTRNVN